MADSDAENPALFTFIWTIGDISYPCFIGSPTFTVKDMDMTRWYLTLKTLYPPDISLSMAREYTNSGPESVEIKYEFSFLGTDGFPIIQKVGTERIRNDAKFGFLEFANGDEVFFQRRSEFMPKDLLTIRCRMWRTGTEIEQPDICFARTLLTQDRYFFVWAIREFSTIQRNEPMEIAVNTTRSKQITLELSLKEKDDKEYVSIDLDFSPSYFGARCVLKLSLLDSEGKIVNVKQSFGCCCIAGRMKECFETKRLVDDKDSLLPSDVMSLRCEIQMEAEVVWSMIDSYRYLHRKRSDNIEMNEEVLHFEQEEITGIYEEFLPFEQVGNIETDEEDLSFEEDENVPSFKESIKDLLKEGTLSDVSLRASTKLFPAHKCILSAFSPVFESIFTEDLQQNTSMSVDIQDLNANALEKLLSYIYTNTMRNLEFESAIDLFRAAENYKLLNLKRVCSNFLKSALSDKSVCAILSVADQLQDRKLQEAAEEYLIYKGENFFTSDAWKGFKEEKPLLALDILERLHCYHCCSEKQRRVYEIAPF